MSTRNKNMNSGGSANVRRDGGDLGAPMTYQGDANVPTPVRGDTQFPFVKDPPDLAGMQLYRDDLTRPAGLPPVTTVPEYEILPAIECDGYRQLELVIEFTPATTVGTRVATGYLSILAEKARNVTGGHTNGLLWAPQGVVNPQLLVPPSVSGSVIPIDAGYATRRVYASELIFDPYEGITPVPAPGTFFAMLTFDVQTASQWRFRVGLRGGAGQLSAPAALNLYYELQR